MSNMSSEELRRQEEMEELKLDCDKLKNIADNIKIFIADCMLDYIDENDLDGADIQLVEHFARYIRNNIK